VLIKCFRHRCRRESLEDTSNRIEEGGLKEDISKKLESSKSKSESESKSILVNTEEKN
jgi:hypothetical protein